MFIKKTLLYIISLFLILQTNNLFANQYIFPSGGMYQCVNSFKWKDIVAGPSDDEKLVFSLPPGLTQSDLPSQIVIEYEVASPMGCTESHIFNSNIIGSLGWNWSNCSGTEYDAMNIVGTHKFIFDKSNSFSMGFNGNEIRYNFNSYTINGIDQGTSSQYLYMLSVSFGGTTTNDMLQLHTQTQESTSIVGKISRVKVYGTDGYCVNQMPTCENNVKDGDETDVDLGGTCGYIPLKPTIQNDYTANVGEDISIQFPEFTDVQGKPLTYSMNGLTSGLSFNPNTRTLTGVFINTGSTILRYIASNGYQSDSIDINFNVQLPSNAEYCTLVGGECLFTDGYSLRNSVVGVNGNINSDVDLFKDGVYQQNMVKQWYGNGWPCGFYNTITSGFKAGRVFYIKGLSYATGRDDHYYCTNNIITYAVAIDNIFIDNSMILNIPTCADGIKNQDEIGIDVGGICGVGVKILFNKDYSNLLVNGNGNFSYGDNPINVNSGNINTLKKLKIMDLGTHSYNNAMSDISGYITNPLSSIIKVSRKIIGLEY